MSWTPNWFQSFCINVLKCGPIPRHIAIIMDGNRRYATEAQVEQAESYERGYNRLAETMECSIALGITEVTVYAFSIDNFKRSDSEVETIMTHIADKFRKWLGDKNKLISDGICYRAIGNLSLLPEDVQKLAAEVVLLTKDNTRGFLNMALAYTSRDEIVNSAKTIIKGVEDGEIGVDDIDEDLITSCLYTTDSPDPDVIIRTSGEVRFSDYLLWQISNSSICFTEVLWPGFCIWNLLACVFKYQRCCGELQKNAVRGQKSERVERFLEGLQEKKMAQLKRYLSYDC